MGRLNQNRSRCRQLLLPSCFSSWWGHTPGRRIGPSVGHSKTAKGASATRTTQEEAEVLRTAWDPSATRTTVVVEVSEDSPRPSSTTRFKTAWEASATRTMQEAVLDFHLGSRGLLLQ